MRNVVLYIAMSLDGYIADANGDVDWLGGQGDRARNRDRIFMGSLLTGGLSSGIIRLNVPAFCGRKGTA